MYILGISAFYHDSAACLLKDGEIIAAAQEERFTRKKHDASFPHQAIKYCLKEANIIASQIDNVVFYEKPFVKFERLLETYLTFAPKGFISFAKAMPVWIKNKLFQKSVLIKEFETTLDENINWQERLLFSEHHLSHAASAFYPSPYENAAVLTLDGVGEWTTTSLAIGKGRDLKVIKEIHFPHSLGLLYSAFTYYTGFKVNSGEYKVMGLAPYGEPRYADLIREKLIKIADDGSFQLDISYFNYATGLTMTNKKFDALFGGPPRTSETKLTQREMDLAASIQKVTEDILIQIAKGIARDTGEKNLCLAGGVALNCVANGILLREKIFDNIWIQPAAGDAGGALGAALSVWYLHHNKERVISSERDAMKGSYLGPEYSDSEIKAELKTCGAVYKRFTKDELIGEVVAALVDKKAIGWMQGRMEFGPRALGGRSIIADPRSAIMQKQLNLKVKFRESFRPFAPSILREDINEWFEHDTDSPYMLLVADVQKDKCRAMTAEEVSLFGVDKLNISRSSVPAITHVDYSARIQTVHADTNSIYHAMISKFKEKTGCPIVVNTSFNVRGEPIVCSPTDAFRCFMGTELDVLAVGNYILYKEEQDETLKKNYKEHYDLD
jgi:carbamoyltransferase|tara:strand:- start:271 stop:2109 length:1839 start_codon:yes stop_codon:yes gene_type:complete